MVLKLYKVGDKFIDMMDNSHIKIKEVYKEKDIDKGEYQIVVNGMLLEYIDGGYLRRYCRKLENE